VSGEPAAPRPAATVVLLRPSARPSESPEVLMIRRTRSASFMADAWVFPGGRVEAADGVARDDGTPDEEGAFRRAAARELAEEAGVVVDPAELVCFAHWITPSAEPKRFSARFFVTEVPAAQVARHDAVEAVAHLWATPADLLERHREGQLQLPPPTLRTLEELAAHRTVSAGLAWARARPVVPILPKLVPLGETLAIVLPWDPDYAALPGDGLPIDPAHPLAAPPSRFVLKDGRWWSRLPLGPVPRP
jgi:8-oxo-dGTP pyrophosphatase MutT (NUDIX family)